MLKILVPGEEFFDEENQEFIRKGDVVLKLEHSLLSLSKWESEYEKPFLTGDDNDKTSEENLGYVKAMCLDPDIPPEVFQKLTVDNYAEINKYVNSRHTATWFSEIKGPPRHGSATTSELIYYWMLQFNIPFTCETWHLERLFTLIKICNIKTAKPTKMSKSEIANRNRELNAQRRAKNGSKG